MSHIDVEAERIPAPQLEQPVGGLELDPDLPILDISILVIGMYEQIVTIVVAPSIGRMTLIDDEFLYIIRALRSNDVLPGPPRLACLRIALRHVRLRDRSARILPPADAG